MKHRILVSPEATAEILEIDTWWRANRDKAPDLFSQELAHVFDTIATLPLAGPLLRGSAVPGVRRAVLRKTRFHVYYRVEGAEVEVLVVWAAMRGGDPDLGIQGR